MPYLKQLRNKKRDYDSVWNIGGRTHRLFICESHGFHIRQNVLELAHLSAEEIHEPWKLNSNPYYEPMIDYESTLQSSKETLYAIKKEPERKPNV